MAVAGLLVAVASIVIATLSLWFGRKAARASVKSAEAAVTAATIERERRHAELRPELESSCSRSSPGSEQWKLRLKLIGPLELGHLDEVTVRIRDKSAYQLKSPTDSERLWGPLRFVPDTGPFLTSDQGTGRADKTGRETRVVRTMPIGEQIVYALEPSRPASSWQRDQWRQEVGSLLRLEIQARRDELDPWRLFMEIDLGAEWWKPST